MQGDFQAHANVLARLDAEPVLVKHAGQVRQVDGLILPGGESTTFLKFLSGEGLGTAIQEAAREGQPLFGTCAGAILLARKVENPEQASLGLLDITVRRNAYGRQVDSFVARGRFQENGETREDLEMVFIRAPVISGVGPEVEVLARGPDSRPVFVRQGSMLAATFHPELTADTRVHSYFLHMVRGSS